jgi:hypothetical protein
MALNVDRSHSARSNLTVLQRMDNQIMYVFVLTNEFWLYLQFDL